MENEKTTFIKRVWTEDTGGGTMVDFVEMSNGIILTITEDSVVAHQGEPWESDKPIGDITLPTS
jgi:hypothetical protein